MAWVYFSGHPNKYFNKLKSLPKNPAWNTLNPYNTLLKQVKLRPPCSMPVLLFASLSMVNFLLHITTWFPIKPNFQVSWVPCMACASSSSIPTESIQNLAANIGSFSTFPSTFSSTTLRFSMSYSGQSSFGFRRGVSFCRVGPTSTCSTSFSGSSWSHIAALVSSCFPLIASSGEPFQMASVPNYASPSLSGRKM